MALILSGAATAAYGASKAAPTVADGAADLADLGVGCLAFFDAETNLMIDGTGVTAAAFNDVKLLQIARGVAVGAIISPIIDRRGTMRYEKLIDSAGVAQVTTCSALAIPAATTARDVYTVVIIDNSKVYLPTNKISFSAYGVFATIAAAVDALVLAINDADTGYAGITASRSTNDLVLTADAGQEGVPFQVGLREELEGGTITLTTPPAEPSGSNAQVTALEKELSVYAGNTNQVWLADKYFSGGSLVEAGETYDLYSIKSVNPYSRKDGMDAQYGREITTMVGMVQSYTGATLWEAVAAFAFGPYAGAPEEGA